MLSLHLHMCSCVTRADVHAHSLLEDVTKQELVKDTRLELKLPASGPLTFSQKRDLSYFVCAVVNADCLLQTSRSKSW